MAEVSGKAKLSYSGFTDLSAATGRFGTLLLDPYDVTITASADSGVSGTTATGDDSRLGTGTIEAALAGANVVVSTGAGGSQAGNLTVDSAIRWSEDTTLTFAAAGEIRINANTAATGAQAGLVLSSGSGHDYSFGSGGAVQLSGSNATVSIEGQPYTLIGSMAALEAINATGLANFYALSGDLDAAALVYSDAVIGSDKAPFSGVFAGLGNTVSNLTISAAGKDNIGLFGFNSGTIRDIGLSGASIDGFVNVGALSGVNSGTIRNAFSAANVVGAGTVGGLVGSNAFGSVVLNSRTSGTVKGDSSVGGLVGSSFGRIENAVASAAVSGRNISSSYLGGLVGALNSYGSDVNSAATGSVTGGSKAGGQAGFAGSNQTSNAFATGDVSGTSEIGGPNETGNVGGTGDTLGGLVGLNDGRVSRSYATGRVTAFNPVAPPVIVAADVGGGVFEETGGGIAIPAGPIGAVGGLVGQNRAGAIVSQAFATGAVINAASGNSTGGLAGRNSGTIENSYSTGEVSSVSNNTGGLVGADTSGTIAQSYAAGAVSGAGAATGGLVGATDSTTIAGSFFDSEKTGRSGAGTGLATAELQNTNGFLALAAAQGWDFETIWAPPGAGHDPELYALSAVVRVDAADQNMT